MLTMQEFYNKLTTNNQQQDPYWRKLTHIGMLRIEELARFAGDLGWYVWFVPPDGNS